MWQKLNCNSKDLQLLGTLNGGQSFRLRFSKFLIKQNSETLTFSIYFRWTLKNEEWTGVFKNTVWKIKQDHTSTYYRVVNSLLINSQDQNNIKKKIKLDNDDIYPTLLREYFQLNVDLQKQYLMWNEKDSNFSKISEKFYGIRVLKQEPIENIFSFICSSNNNIQR